MIIITGATGQLGKLVAQKLLDRVPAAQVGVSGFCRKKLGSMVR